MKTNDIKDFDELIDRKYGPRGTKEREEWERGAEKFKIGVLLEEARLKLGLTQEQLAEKCGTNKSYISRIENDASDIRFSTLQKIIHRLGGRVTVEFD